MKLTIIRGVPGSGKSTIARGINAFHVEADMYFMRNGKYCWSASEIKKAHQWCLDAATDALARGMDVVVSNTFVTKSQYAKYVDIALGFGADVEIIVARGNFKDIHDVPESALDRMRTDWEE